MTYSETLNWMFRQLPMYQREGKSAYKVDLSNTYLLVNHLNNPEKKFKSIHVAGTNGKGSTSHMLASILQEAGYKVGLYTSPHLKDFRERIKINGEPIPEVEVVSFIKTHKSFFEANSLSFFEMTVGLAFDYFSKSAIDIAIIEVGLGGRLDSTNVITPEVSIITNIGLDHTAFLGDTLPLIAAEKAGVIKDGVPIIVGQVNEEVLSVIENKAKQHNAPMSIWNDNVEVFKTDLRGWYQSKNMNVAIRAINQLKGFKIDEKDIEQGLLNVIKNTGLLGRWQILKNNPKVICDTAHNKHGLIEVMNQLTQEDYKELHIVLGVVADKKLQEILPLFPKEATYYFCCPDIPRGLNEKDLCQTAKEFLLKGNTYNSVSEAYGVALKNADNTDVIYIGGSTFVVAEII